MEGMGQQGHTVIVLVFTTDTELFTDLQVPAVFGLQRIFVDMLRIVNLHLGVEELTNILFIIFSGNPTLTELQTDIIKGNLLRNDSRQSSLCLFQSRNDACINIIPRLLALNHIEGFTDIFQLLIDIT